LPAIAAGQALMSKLTPRHRRQASPHIWLPCCQWCRLLACSRVNLRPFAAPPRCTLIFSKVPAMPWLQVRLAISPEQAETYEDAFLEVGAVSVTFMDAEDQPIFEPELNTTPLWSHTHLLALFEDGTDASSVFAHMELLTGGPLPEHHSEVIEDQDWERSWMDNFQPMRFGQRLWIVPSWHAAPEPEAVNLLLDPGLAFGTGTHPTTALCLEWLDGQDLKDCNVLDFGCGSGILAIAALLLGAKEAVGTDIDVQALEASRDNAGRNNIPEGCSHCTCRSNCPRCRPMYWSPTSSPARWFRWPRNCRAWSSRVVAWRCRGSSPSRAKKSPPPTPRTSIWTRSPTAMAGYASAVVGARIKRLHESGWPHER
jgi:ribosomal protein L11 methyltransferase